MEEKDIVNEEIEIDSENTIEENIIEDKIVNEDNKIVKNFNNDSIFKELLKTQNQDVYNLIGDSDFREFASNKIDFMKFEDICNDYKLFNQKIDKLAEEKAEKLFLKRISSPGSLSSITNGNYSKSNSWNSMSEQEFERAINDAKRGYYSSITKKY